LKVHGNDRDKARKAGVVFVFSFCKVYFVKVLASLSVAVQRFAAFTVGDVISILHDEESYNFFILDAKPGKAVNCVASGSHFLEMELDFVQPVDFAESAEALRSSTNQLNAFLSFFVLQCQC
jgi:hypothetical protein